MTDTTKRPIIFVDIDGPLLPFRAHWIASNVEMMKLKPDHQRGKDEWFRSFDKAKHVKFDPCAVAYLNVWTEFSGANLVLSTNWVYYRTKDELQHIFESNGIKAKFDDRHELSWTTPRRLLSNSKDRTSEICEWLADNGKPDKFVIIDDDPRVCGLVTTWDQCCIDHPNPLSPERVGFFGRPLTGHIIPVNLLNGISFEQFNDGMDMLGIDINDVQEQVFGIPKLSEEEMAEKKRLRDEAIAVWMNAVL